LSKAVWVKFYLRSTQEMILRKYSRATVYPVPRDEIELWRLYIAEKFRVIITEVWGVSTRESIVLYAESADRHADFISFLYHSHPDEAKKET